jgi:hypothetical protein
MVLGVSSRPQLLECGGAIALMLDDVESRWRLPFACRKSCRH